MEQAASDIFNETVDPKFPTIYHLRCSYMQYHYAFLGNFGQFSLKTKPKRETIAIISSTPKINQK